LLIFPKGDSNFGQNGFLKACRQAFDRIVFIEHLEARQRPKGGKRWLGIVPGLGLWWHKRRVLSRRGSRYADCIVAVSRQVRNRLVDDLGFDSRKVFVVHNGVAWQRLRRDESVGAGIRKKYAIPRDAMVFGMLSRLHPQKGIDLAIRALSLIVAKDPSTRAYLAIAGEGAQLQELRELSRQLGVENRTNFLGFVRDPVDILSAYDVILFSSRNEGLPLALLEGMAAGCIPIVTRISGMPEAVNSPDIGWVVSPESPRDLCAAMQSVLRLDTRRISELRDASARRVRENFDLAQSQRRILELSGLSQTESR
jgi:glycosyltransferase involved in cell wall biosynthesis